jgi:signal transduction histidine kinase
VTLSPGGRRDEDARATRRASRLIGWQIMLASAILVLGIIAVSIIFIIHQSLPREQIDQLKDPNPRVYVDTADVFQALVIIGIGAVVFAGLVSWIIAGRAVRPLGLALRLQREFVADASHELRTPLAVLDARIQVLQRRLAAGVPGDAEATAETVKALRSDSRALIDIVNDLLLAADPSAEGERSDPVATEKIVTDAVDSLRILASDRNVVLVVEVTDVLVRIPATSLRRCVIALVDNAVVHSPDGGTVTIRAVRKGSRFVLTVADNGRGITGIEPERIFERFAHEKASVQLDATAAPARQSFGIGLALVRDIATRQGGSVRVEATSASGTTMRLELPASE